MKTFPLKSGSAPHVEKDVNLRDHFATIALAQIIASKPDETAEKRLLKLIKSLTQ